MSDIVTFENFEKEIKRLEMDHIRMQEQLKISTQKADELLSELKTLTGKGSIDEIIEMMKVNKEELSKLKVELDNQIKQFNEDLKEYEELKNV